MGDISSTNTYLHHFHLNSQITTEGREATMRWLMLIISVAVVVRRGSTEDLSNGWGADYAWVDTMEAAQNKAIQQWKPIMFIIHKSWCGACKKLKSLFANDDEVLELSENFVMINLGDDKEPAEEKFKPDGGYIPRIFFLHPDGSLLTDVINKEGNPKFKYYYYSTESVLDSMDEVLELSKSWEEKPNKDEL